MPLLTKQKKISCGYSHSKSEKRPLRATGFNLLVSRGGHTRERGQSPGYSPGHPQATGAVVQQPLEGGENPETTTTICKKAATMAT